MLVAENKYFRLNFFGRKWISESFFRGKFNFLSIFVQEMKWGQCESYCMILFTYVLYRYPFQSTYHPLVYEVWIYTSPALSTVRFIFGGAATIRVVLTFLFALGRRLAHPYKSLDTKEITSSLFSSFQRVLGPSAITAILLKNRL